MFRVIREALEAVVQLGKLDSLVSLVSREQLE